MTKLIPDCRTCGANGDEDGVLIQAVDHTYTTGCRACGAGLPVPAALNVARERHMFASHDLDQARKELQNAVRGHKGRAVVAARRAAADAAEAAYSATAATLGAFLA